MKPLFFLSFLLVFGGFWADDFEPRSRSMDDYYMEIEVVEDSAGIPDRYKANITTPVCEDDKCYIVKIVFYWDLIGRFLAYDTIPGEGLTKLDHIPFTEEDYAKLDKLLKDPNSALKSYSKEELVQDTRNSEIDGLTGATVQEVKEAVIGGGVYSCYTLWHIAHGSAVDSLKRQTATLFDKPLVNKLVAQQDQDINYFLLEHFSEEEFAQYLPQVLQTVKDGKGYYVKNAIEKMPHYVLADSTAQAFFAQKYPTFNYFTQVALLKKMPTNAIIPAMADTLQRGLDDRNSAKNDLIKKLLAGGE